ncbi:TetR/AcrR family transcriptional regulator [Marinobacter bryozoorum]|uniref:TetR/AcrR family transcriptional regulator n=1 Tax=Marinobacter bryozoorum TaxID=256324 RepID=UPI0020030E27|nr:TetR/AcrR family transcriptional regulator [Marinobacter bryozoorum]MCK7544735.1 TetR/AcrR family transcriptional regulator [Marinobacter bryozoorum]
MSRPSSSQNPRTRPLKRPRQARARFTVQAIYDAYVRIWQRDGWEQLTTRKVALETGIAIGTLYDYFPSKEALHSGYVRHCIEQMIQHIDEQVVAPAGLTWRQRIHLLIHHLAGLADDKNTWFSPDMMWLEPAVADTRLQQRAYDELLAVWHRVIAACDDLTPRPADTTLEALHLSVWGGRRYGLQVELDDERRRAWAAELERLCTTALAHSNE